ncbi:hypothetical protein SDC9_174514 [bioreactor metagenome]|uniref:Uncharacterized protein n=1 Tax=bioreactor metagenome TaxID=1076179 RepID=A0A645GJK8_9ZZZZ
MLRKDFQEYLHGVFNVGDARRAIRLVRLGMRRVVGGEAVDRSVQNALNQRERVAFCAQRGIDLVVAVEPDQVVRGYLAGNRQPFRLGGANHVYRLRAADVADVEIAAHLA